MKLRNKLALAISATIFAGAASAATIDYRHEWRVESKKQANRVKLSTGFKINRKLTTNVGVEMKFASNDATNAFDEVVLTETELDLGLSYKLNKNLQIRPGMPIAMTDEKTTLKPQVRVVYRANNGITTGLRYRHEFANYIEGEGDTNQETGLSDQHPQKSKVTLTGSYKIRALPNLKLSYEANYIKSWNNVNLFDENDWEYDAGVIVGYQFGNWQPYTEFWTIDKDSKASNRELKWRAGMTYKF